MQPANKTQLQLGFVPLTDSAPLVMAKELGFFQAEGLDVALRKQNSWATLRDKLQVGILDGAQMLAPMPLASQLGLGGNRAPIITPFVLSFNGNAITLSESLCRELCELHGLPLNKLPLPLPASLLKAVIDKRIQEGRPAMKFATVFAYSCHYYQLRQWFSDADIELGTEVEVQVLPPTSMVAALHEGVVDGYCVGGPWNAKAVRAGLGLTATSSCDIWPDQPEKVLGITQSWMQANPDTTGALIRALKRACNWLEELPNRFEAARILCSATYLNADLDVVAPTLLGSCLVHQGLNPRTISAYNRFRSAGQEGNNNPDSYYGRFLLNQMVEAGHIQLSQYKQIDSEQVFRADVYAQALRREQTAVL
ncbi:CmpA/NrtA family ABC transporter substrate-binding protein [Lacimicrobium alkaliphilum]|uniref:Nitrate transporter n=1 Tax=Lacimicrobium alkaliphilum TaxID=1526571 RepID=A0ABQ1RLN2_9ALTE|nr:CmpA/NrtA family ABC transporter substrate-binding protein [Lacimicrobium alkaliphilum]GGD74018.1 nitrate transporter [Lacimicrobium alkaliphilum]